MIISKNPQKQYCYRGKTTQVTYDIKCKLISNCRDSITFLPFFTAVQSSNCVQRSKSDCIDHFIPEIIMYQGTLERPVHFSRQTRLGTMNFYIGSTNVSRRRYNICGTKTKTFVKTNLKKKIFLVIKIFIFRFSYRKYFIDNR